MARIRSIKPEFFRDETLQDLEADNPGQHVMLVFAGLWGHCDKEGRFAWKPRTLKLDILPFLDFDLRESLALLKDAGFIKQYEIDGVLYGEVPTFKEHQRISGKEAQEDAKCPEPNGYLEGSTGEATGKQSGRQEGKGREGNGVQEGKGIVPGEVSPVSPSGPDPVARMVEAWNVMAADAGLSRVDLVNTSRRSAAMARLKDLGMPRDGPDAALEGWNHALRKIAASPFLTGRNDRGWRATFDVMTTPSKFTRLMEGAYDVAPGTGNAINDAFEELARGLH